MRVGEWAYSEQDRQVVDVETVWGSSSCHVWLPAEARVARLSSSQLQPFVRRVDVVRHALDDDLLVLRSQVDANWGRGGKTKQPGHRAGIYAPSKLHQSPRSLLRQCRSRRNMIDN